MGKKPGEVITFYSYKGGVGRTMALANVATLLAQGRRSVLAVDFDLEAPGLHRYFLTQDTSRGEERFHPSGPQLGLIELFIELQDWLNSLSNERSLDWESEDTRQMAKGIIATLLDSGRYLYEISVRNPNSKDGRATLSFLAAGRFDEGYPARVRGFDWQRFYDKFAEVLPLFIEELKNRFEYILIDSRTGVSDTGSICTVVFPDKLVLAFAPNRQSLYGALEVGRQVLKQRVQPGERVLALYPLLCRLEDGEQLLKERWIERARGEFERLFQEENAYWAGRSLAYYFETVRIPHRTFYTYGEEIAAEREKTIETTSLAAAFQKSLVALLVQDIASYLEGTNILYEEKIGHSLLDVQQLCIKVYDDQGRAVTGAQVFLVAANGTYLNGITGQDGQVSIEYFVKRQVTIMCAHPKYKAYLKIDHMPEASLSIQLERAENVGSIICANGVGNVPGLVGRLNPIQDSPNRTYLYADNIAIEGGKSQPVTFQLGHPIEVVDSQSNRFILKFIQFIGRTSLIEFTNMGKEIPS